MVVATGLTGFESPDVVARYFGMRDWVDAAQGQVCVAMVAQSEIIDFEKIGAIAGQNVGFRFNVFTSEEDALVWLKSAQPVARGDTVQFFRR